MPSRPYRTTLTKEQLVERARKAGKASAANATPSSRVDALITAIVNRAPELSDEQRSRLASVLRPSGGASA